MYSEETVFCVCRMYAVCCSFSSLHSTYIEETLFYAYIYNFFSIAPQYLYLHAVTMRMNDSLLLKHILSKSCNNVRANKIKHEDEKSKFPRIWFPRTLARTHTQFDSNIQTIAHSILDGWWKKKKNNAKRKKHK